MGRITLSDIKLLPYNYSNQDSVALAERWIHWPIEHNVGFRNRHIRICSLDFSQDGKPILWRKNILFDKWCCSNLTSIDLKKNSSN